MSSSASAYAAFSTLLAEAALPVSPAELHGHLLGRVCGGAGFDENDWLAAASELLGGAPGERLQAALSGLLGMVQQEFAGQQVALVLMLPPDEFSLVERTAALGEWCQGFLAGFGLSGRTGEVSGEAREVLEDLAAIAQIQEPAEEGEEGENDFMEVTEYLRVAPLLLYGEYGRGSLPEPAPVVH